jgi:hypothetical protein
MDIEEALKHMRDGKWIKSDSTKPITIIKNHNGVEFLLVDNGILVEHDIKVCGSLSTKLFCLSEIKDFEVLE